MWSRSYVSVDAGGGGALSVSVMVPTVRWHVTQLSWPLEEQVAIPCSEPNDKQNDGD